MAQEVRTKEEIKKAIEDINNNKRLTYGYREDVEAVLDWVLMGEEFDGLNGN